MFCPNCGAKSLELNQRFCKTCGTNLKAVNDILERGDSKTTVLGVDVGNLVKSVKDSVDMDGIVKSVKESVGDVTVNKDLRRKERRMRRELAHQDYNDRWLEHEQRKTRIEEERLKRHKLQQQRTPKPKEWMGYSWQHNLKYGLLSLCSGTGLGIFLYYLSKIGIESGLLAEIIAQSEVQITGLEPVVRMVWLIALIPILKGFGQIFYAAFFAESLATLSERFAPRTLPEEKAEKFLFASQLSRDTAPQAVTAPEFDDLNEAPPSVTETTTRTLEEARLKQSQ